MDIASMISAHYQDKYGPTFVTKALRLLHGHKVPTSSKPITAAPCTKGSPSFGCAKATGKSIRLPSAATQVGIVHMGSTSNRNRIARTYQPSNPSLAQNVPRHPT